MEIILCLQIPADRIGCLACHVFTKITKFYNIFKIFCTVKNTKKWKKGIKKFFVPRNALSVITAS